MSTKYTFSLKEGSEKEKKLKDLEALLSLAKAKSRVKAVRTGKKDIFEFVPDGESVDEDDNGRSFKIQTIRAIKNSSFSPLRKLSNLVNVTTSDRMEYLKMWPSFSLKLEEAFHFEDGTCSSIVDLILDMAEKDVENGIERTVEQWYNTIVLVLNGMKVAAEKKSQMEAKVNSFEKEIRELNLKLGKAQEADIQRVKEIDRWYVSYEEAHANAEEQRKKYEKLAEEATYKQKKREEEINRLKKEKTDLQQSLVTCLFENKQFEKEISQLRSQLEANSKNVSEEKNSIAANPAPIADKAEIESYKKKLKALKKKNTELQEKLDNAGETLTVLADGVKEYVDEVGVDKAYDLFNRLNTILIDVQAWTKHASALKKVFKKARKEMQNRNMVQGDYVVNKHVDKEVNGVSAGATGILINNNED